jgi:hypothetical protein
VVAHNHNNKKVRFYRTFSFLYGYFHYGYSSSGTTTGLPACTQPLYPVASSITWYPLAVNVDAARLLRFPLRQ